MNLTEISKIISHALRHEPHVYELELDDQGWVSIDKLIASIKEATREQVEIDLSTIKKIIEISDKPRFEVLNRNIRALYGHSLPQKLSYISDEPPGILYHGTTLNDFEKISVEGLKPMLRQYVHLSTNVKMATTVAKRKGDDIVILEIDSALAFKDGYKFYRGNQYVWLCDNIPAKYIKK
jgi:putative RNA 2'-phosphotransferase